VAASIISIVLNPSIYRWARRLSSAASELTPVAQGSVRRLIPVAASWSDMARSGRSCDGSSMIVVPQSR